MKSRLCQIYVAIVFAIPAVIGLSNAHAEQAQPTVTNHFDIDSNGNFVYKRCSGWLDVAMTCTSTTAASRGSTTSSADFSKFKSETNSRFVSVEQRISKNEENIAKGLNFSAGESGFNAQLGDTISFTGDKNISTTVQDKSIQFSLSDNPVFDGTITANGLVIKPNGGIDLGGNVVANMGAGKFSSDSLEAINGSQLYRIAQDTATSLGGGATVTDDGHISAPTYTVVDAKTGQKINHHDVGSAVKSLNDNASVASQDLANMLGGGAKVGKDGRVEGPNYGIKDLSSGKIISHKNIGNALNALQKNINHVRRESYENTATAMAVAGLGQALQPNQLTFGIATGIYNGRVGYALGASYMQESGKLLFKGAVSTNNSNHVGATVGATYYFD